MSKAMIAWLYTVAVLVAPVVLLMAGDSTPPGVSWT